MQAITTKSFLLFSKMAQSKDVFQFQYPTNHITFTFFWYAEFAQ